MLLNMTQRGMWAMIACSIMMAIWIVWLSYMDRKQARRIAAEGHGVHDDVIETKVTGEDTKGV